MYFIPILSVFTKQNGMNLKRYPQQLKYSFSKRGDILFGSPGPLENSAPVAAGRVFNKNRKQSDPNKTRNHLGLLGRRSEDL